MNAVRDEFFYEFGNTDRVSEFDTWQEAQDEMFRRGGRFEYTVCGGLRKQWAVRPLSDGEKERNAYYREAPL